MKSKLALELERVWQEQPAAWYHHRAGWGTSCTEKDAKGFWITSNNEHITMKKGIPIPGYRKYKRNDKK